MTPRVFSPSPNLARVPSLFPSSAATYSSLTSPGATSVAMVASWSSPPWLRAPPTTPCLARVQAPRARWQREGPRQEGRQRRRLWGPAHRCCLTPKCSVGPNPSAVVAPNYDNAQSPHMHMISFHDTCWPTLTL